MQLYQNDIFNDALEDFKSTSLADSLQKEFTPKPYYKKYRGLYILGLIASYVFNSFSAVTASALIYFFLVSYIAALPSLGFTIAFLLLVELSKRKTSKILFKEYVQFKKLGKGLLFIVCLLSTLSVVSSYFGAKKVILEFTEKAPTIALDTLQNFVTLETKIKELDKSIADARETTWNNTTTRTSQKTIKELAPLKTALELELSNLRTKTTDQNEIIKADHQTATGAKAEYFAGVTLLLEFLFLGCQFWTMTYKYNSLAQFSSLETVTMKRKEVAQVEQTQPHQVTTNLRHTENRISKTIEPNSNDLSNGKETNDTTQPNDKKRCQNCSKDISHKTKKAKYCNDKCRLENWEKKNKRKPFLKKSKG